MEQTTVPDRRQPDIRTLCSHIFADAHPCGSPALRGEAFCFYHHPAHTRVPTRAQRRAHIHTRRAAIRAAREPFTLPVPATRAELQRSLCEILRGIPRSQIDHRHAEVLASALQLAARSLRT
jgi:hypothetical protein